MEDIDTQRVQLWLTDPIQSNVLINVRLFESENTSDARYKMVAAGVTLHGQLTLRTRLDLLIDDGELVTRDYRVGEDARQSVDEAIIERYGLSPEALSADLRLAFSQRPETRDVYWKKQVKKLRDLFKSLGYSLQIGGKSETDSIFSKDDPAHFTAVTVSTTGKVKKEDDLYHLAGLFRSVDDDGKGYGLLIAGSIAPNIVRECEKLRFTCLSLLDWYRLSYWFSKQNLRQVSPLMNHILNVRGHIDIEKTLNRIERGLKSTTADGKTPLTDNS